MPARARARSALGVVRRILRLRTLRVLATYLHAVSLMVAVESTIRWVSLPTLSRRLGVPLDLGPTTSSSPPASVPLLGEAARRQISCAWRVAAVWPFSDGPCLRRSLVVGRLIRRHGPSLRIGIRGGADDMVAHAWLEIDGHPLEPIDDLKVFQRVADGTPR